MSINLLGSIYGSGRRTPVLIDSQTLAAATGFTSASFVAETYSKITLEIEGLETATTFAPQIQLIGTTTPGTGPSRHVYTSASTNTVADDATHMYGTFVSGGNVNAMIEIFPLTTGRPRHLLGRSSSDGVGGVSLSYGRAHTADTAHGITAVGWTGSTSFTGTVRVWGVPK